MYYREFAATIDSATRAVYQLPQAEKQFNGQFQIEKLLTKGRG